MLLNEEKSVKNHDQSCKSDDCNEYETNNLLFGYYKLMRLAIEKDVVAINFVFGWVLTLFAVEVLSFQFGTLTSRFYALLPKREASAFGGACLQFATFIIMMALGKATQFGTKGLLARSMRRNLTHHFHGKLISFPGMKSLNRSKSDYLHSNSTFGRFEGCDAPDQRVTEDVDRFCKGIVEVGEIVFVGPTLVTFYTGQIYQKLGFTALGVIYGHFVVSIIVLRLGMAGLKKLTVEKERREAAFRHEHVNLSTNLESFVMTGSQGLIVNVKKNFDAQLKRLLFTSKRLIVLEAVMEMGKNFFSYSGALINFVLLAWEVGWGRWRVERDVAKIAELISMTSFLSLYLIFQLSKVAGITDLLGTLNGHAFRLIQLLKQIDSTDSLNLSISNPDEKVKIEFINYSIVSQASGKVLYGEPVNLTLQRGKQVSIHGPNGSGKTTLLRSIFGLEKASETFGYLQISGGDKGLIMACPQTPVMFTGSLEDLLGFDEEAKENQEGGVNADVENINGIHSQDGRIDLIERVFEIVGLSDATILLEDPKKKRSIQEWKTILTSGQHQRLALARAILLKPQILILDETFVGLSGPDEEKRLLKTLIETEGISVVMIDPAPPVKEVAELFNESLILCK